jgi:hypothetical protein
MDKQDKLEKQLIHSRASFSEIGASGFRRFGGQVYEEFLQQLRGLAGIRAYREMRDNDPIIGAVMFAIEQVIEKASWYIRAGGTSALDKEAAEFLKSCMHDMTHTWQDFIGECLTMLTYGWCWIELCYKQRKGFNSNPKLSSRENDGLIGWQKLARRHQQSFYEWLYDEKDQDLVGFAQMPPPSYKIREIPLYKSIHLRTKLDSENPDGRSILRNAYRPWYFKKNIEEIEAIGLERDLVGLPIIHPAEGIDLDDPEHADIKEELKKIVANLRRDEQDGIVLPFGFELELLGNGNSRRQFDTDKIINRYDKRVAASVLAQFIMLGMDRVGSFALNKGHSDLFLVAVQSMLNKLAEQINRNAIPKLFAANAKFAVLGSKLPYLKPSKVTDPNLSELADYVMKLGGKGFMLPKKHILDELEDIAGLSGRDINRIGEIDNTQDDDDIIMSPLLPAPKTVDETAASSKNVKDANAAKKARKATKAANVANIIKFAELLQQARTREK